MKNIVETKPPLNEGDTAVHGYFEAAGFVGMPGIDRNHFDPRKVTPVAESPDVVIGRPKIIVPET